MRQSRPAPIQQDAGIPSSQYPQNVEFRQLLKQLDMSQAALARRIDVHVDTVSRWCKHECAVPHVVVLYLRLLALVRTAALQATKQSI